ncbi:MAG: EFR1 family ferrodoxin [Bacteroidales bacterium]|jgi:NAD-dependent dihydropyrimidine dehydrogenase PreA subunit/flavodoxin|nr:EFR1 family ferrodoxin [Bacteroidales bacterium]
MVFFFSATGNSKYVARQIADNHNQTMIDIGKMSKEGNYTFELSDQEMIGFVFPVYFGGIPTIVRDFISKLQLKNYNQNYVFAVCTCGAIAANTLNATRRLLKRHKIKMNVGFAVRMVDNYVLMWNLLPPKEQWAKINRAAEAEIHNINGLIRFKTNGISKKYATIAPVIASASMYDLFYTSKRSTKPFYATDKCVNCGLCAKICPVNSIEMIDEKPQWVTKKCCQCLACLHRCPQRAIEYGKKTLKRDRYVNQNISLEN